MESRCQPKAPDALGSTTGGQGMDGERSSLCPHGISVPKADTVIIYNYRKRTSIWTSQRQVNPVFPCTEN